MIHLKRLVVGFLIGSVTFGLGYGLTGVAMTVKDFGLMDIVPFIVGTFVIAGASYLVGWTVVGK